MGGCFATYCPCLEGLLSSRAAAYRSIDDDDLETTACLRNGAPPALPTHFSKTYRLGELLGSGTTSRVFRVYRCSRCSLSAPCAPTESDCGNGYQRADSPSPSPSSPGPPLACKIIDKAALALGVEDNELVLTQLRKEIDLLRRVQHPHIVRYFDYTETATHILIVTEFLSGGELFDWLSSRGPLDERHAKTAFYGLFSAIAYLHDRGVIHRDIKAENVILTRRERDESERDNKSERGGERESEREWTMKLIDFGFSTHSPFSLTESFLGTGGYIAPEIRQGRSYSSSVDDWALGVLLYCALCGKMPFSTSIDLLPPSQRELQKIFRLRFPASLWDKVSSEAKALVAALLQVDPLQRMSAKNALKHPWFAEVAAKKAHLSAPQARGSTLAEHHRLSKRHFVELPEIRCALRRMHSTTPLDKRRVRGGGGAGGATPYHYERESDVSSLRSSQTPCLSRGMSTDALQSDTDTAIFDFAQSGSRCASAASDKTVTTSESTARSTADTLSVRRARSETLQESEREKDKDKEKLFLSTRSECVCSAHPPRHALVWDDVHHHHAGDLFYSTLIPRNNVSKK